MGRPLGVGPGTGDGGFLERLGPVLALALSALACHGDAAPARAVPGDRGPALVVEVLNAGAKPGLARVATRLLREAGVDVVYYGNAAPEIGRLDSTRIVVRRGSPELAERVRRALGAGRVSVELDAARLLDASVLLGADFAPRPSREDFHP